MELNALLTNLENFSLVSKVMAQYFSEHYPARAAVGVAELPRVAGVEIEAVMVTGT